MVKVESHRSQSTSQDSFGEGFVQNNTCPHPRPRLLRRHFRFSILFPLIFFFFLTHFILQLRFSSAAGTTFDRLVSHQENDLKL